MVAAINRIANRLMRYIESNSMRQGIAGLPKGRAAFGFLSVFWLVWMGWVFSAGVTVFAQDNKFSEYELKAAVIYNFNKYIQWPQTPESPYAPIIVGIIGKDPFNTAIDRVFKLAKPIEGRQLVVRRLKNVSEAADCRILFIGEVEKKELLAIIKAVEKQPILTIGETEGFCESGGMILLKMVDNRVAFEINDQAGKQAGLQFSSKLVRQSLKPSTSK